jgi:hypothetical protein
MRRVDCRRCGVVAVEEVPWGDGKRTLTNASDYVNGSVLVIDGGWMGR